MDKRRKKQILQYERGNCDGCKHRGTAGAGHGTCDFYMHTKMHTRKDRQGNCKENTSKKEVKR